MNSFLDKFRPVSPTAETNPATIEEIPKPNEFIDVLNRMAGFLERMQGQAITTDFFEHRIETLAASTSGTLNLETKNPFSYVTIPNAPRDLTLVGLGNTMGHRLTKVLKGQTLNLTVSQTDHLSINYSSGFGDTDFLDVYLSVRPFQVNLGNQPEVALDSGSGIFLVSQSDTVNDPNGPFRAIVFGTVGVLRLTTPENADITIPSGVLSAGIVHPMRIHRVWTTSTTAANIYGLT